jgi:RND family efflux transporter MFP subunit
MNYGLSYSLLLLIGTTLVGLPAGITATSPLPDNSGLPGITKPSLQVTLHPNVAGIVQEILVSEGATVHRDEPLVRMDDRVAQANLTAAEVAAQQLGPVDLAKAELQAAIQSLQRFESIGDSRAVSAQELELARAAVDKAKANLTTAEGNLRLAREKVAIERERINQLTLTAPFDGVINRIKATAGERLQEDQIVLELVNTEVLKVEVHVPSRLHGTLAVGELYGLHTDFNNLGTIEGKLTAVSPIVDPSTDTVRCVFEIDNQERKLPAGFLVHFGNTK